MLILFDIDDTLLDHSSASQRAAATLHQKIGASISQGEFVAKWADALERHYARYLAGEVSHKGQRRDRVRDVIDPSLSDDAADRTFAQYLDAYEAGWSLFSDVLPCLNSLSPHRLGVISNGPEQQQRRKLVQTGIVDRFACIVTSDEYGFAKPDPRIFRHACAQAGELPENSIYVGDRYHVDALAARAAGLSGVWLDRHQALSRNHAPPIIDSLVALGILVADRSS
jgi:putative hydrolase of the HAD superfamily